VPPASTQPKKRGTPVMAANIAYLSRHDRVDQNR
jgi:hypothetical protein